MQISLGDQILESGGEITLDDTTRIVISDEYKKVGKGKPLVLHRTYEKLSGNSAQSFKSGGEGDEVAKEQASELTGKTVEFAWNEEDEEYELSFVDEEGDEDLLQHVDEDMDLRAFLPEADAKEGSTWTVHGKAGRILLFPGGDLKLEDTETEEGEPDQSELDLELIENVETRIDATFKSMREEDGKKLAVIALEGEVTTKGGMDSEEAGKIDVSVSGRVTGEILWDVTARHVHSANVSVEQSVSYSRSHQFDMGGEMRTLLEKLELSGTSKFELEVGK
jgi:hypothetical protein